MTLEEKSQFSGGLSIKKVGEKSIIPFDIQAILSKIPHRKDLGRPEPSVDCLRKANTPCAVSFFGFITLRAPLPG